MAQGELSVFQMVQKQVELRHKTPDILITETKEKEWKLLDEELKQIVDDFHHNYDDFCAKGERVLTFNGERIISFEIQAREPHPNMTKGFWMPVWTDKEGVRHPNYSMTTFKIQVSEYLLKYV